jgi:hypothetical protein
MLHYRECPGEASCIPPPLSFSSWRVQSSCFWQIGLPMVLSFAVIGRIRSWINTGQKTPAGIPGFLSAPSLDRRGFFCWDV